MKRLLITAFLPFVVMAKPVHIDEILTQSNTFKLDMSVAYSNIQRANGVIAPISYQTQNGDFVSVPTYFGENKTNQDYLNYAFTLRYGVTRDLELFTSVNFYSSNIAVEFNNEFDLKNSSGFNAVNVGAIYQVKSEDDAPSLLIGMSTNPLEKTRFDVGTLSSKFKGFRFFATSFYTVDPVVFLLDVSYCVALNKTFEDKSIDNGDILTISPQIYFAVNPFTSLNWGVKYTHYAINRVDDKQISAASSNLSFLMGLSYEFSAKTILNVNTEYLNSNGIVQSNFSTVISYKF